MGCSERDRTAEQKKKKRRRRVVKLGGLFLLVSCRCLLVTYSF